MRKNLKVNYEAMAKKLVTWDIYLGNRYITSATYLADCTRGYVKSQLIKDDGLPSAIKVVKRG